MPILRRLRDSGFSIWPFDAPGRPLVVEIYPRLLTGKVRKSSAASRRAYLRERPGLRAQLGSGPEAACAAGEDAFDAAVSAVAMADHLHELDALDREEAYALEGRIWRPPALASPDSGPAA